LEEGKKIRDRLNGELNLLEDIKQEKLENLKELNVYDKYTSELARKKIEL
jgi:hypothetical protein